MSQPWLRICVVFVAAFSIASSTAAQESEDHSQRAADLAAEAALRYEAGDVQGAIDLFHEAMEYVADPAFAFNLASLYDYIEDLPQAHRFYTRYLELYMNAPNQADVEARLAELEQTLSLAFARLIVTSQPPGAEITVTTGGEPQSYGLTPVDQWVPAGRMEIAAQLEGFEPASRTTNVVLGVRVEVDFGVLAPKQDELPPPPEATWYKPVGWTSIAVGIVGIGVGSYMWVLAGENADTHNELVQEWPDELTEQDAQFLKDGVAEGQATIGNVVFGVGAAAVVVGVLVLVLDPSLDQADLNVTAQPFFFSHGAGFGWEGQF